MDKLLIILAFISISLTSCSTDDSFSQNAYQTPSLPYYTDDTTGQDNFPIQKDTNGHKLFIFDPKIPAWAVYDETGERVQTGRASGGKGYCPDIHRECRTVTGSYTVYHKKGPECVSSIFPIEDGGGAPMPNCMFFHGGYSIHGSYFVPNYNASHGCIRVLPSAAEWLNNDFITVGTRVKVLSY